jgi:hypothetical protein
MFDRRHRLYTWLMAGVVVCYFISSFIPSAWSVFIFYGAFVIAALIYGASVAEDRQRREAIRRAGVELEAEILERYDAGVPSREALKSPMPLRSSEDPLELELRYTFEGREIVSRSRISTKTYFHTRGLKTLKIKVSPEQPEEWVEVA